MKVVLNNGLSLALLWFLFTDGNPSNECNLVSLRHRDAFAGRLSFLFPAGPGMTLRGLLLYFSLITATLIAWHNCCICHPSALELHSTAKQNLKIHVYRTFST